MTKEQEKKIIEMAKAKGVKKEQPKEKKVKTTYNGYKVNTIV